MQGVVYRKVKEKGRDMAAGNTEVPRRKKRSLMVVNAPSAASRKKTQEMEEKLTQGNSRVG
jgi:hypothetical protein